LKLNHAVSWEGVIASEARQSNPAIATGLPRFARNNGFGSAGFHHIIVTAPYIFLISLFYFLMGELNASTEKYFSISNFFLSSSSIL
jgi:lysozyme family protein